MDFGWGECNGVQYIEQKSRANKKALSKAINESGRVGQQLKYTVIVNTMITILNQFNLFLKAGKLKSSSIDLSGFAITVLLLSHVA